MGPGAILFPILYFGFLALLGAVVLACIPQFRLNGSNVLTFVVGAVIGHLAIAGLFERLMYRPAGFLRGFPEGFAFPFILVGVIGGGIGAVTLRMRRNRNSQKQNISPL